MADIDMSSINDVLSELQTKKYGRYKGVVTDNIDPDRRGRVKVQVEAVFGATETDWIEGIFPLGGNSDESFVFVPAIGSIVTVEFIGGDISAPVWTGTYYAPDVTHTEALDEAGDVLSLIRTRSGLEIRIRDDGEKHSLKILTAEGAEIGVDEDGNLKMTDKNGAGVEIAADDKSVKLQGHGQGSLTIDDSTVTATDGSASIEISNGNITMDATSIKLNGDQVDLGRGASSPILNATAFMQLYAAHVHTPAPPGPPTPPIVLQAVKLLKVKGA
ncbi:phage baseplate assembly protein V [Hoeflea ulvae]|uniref:Phage baseplate assembly protein V n=1 Tax=Hoeflea ulvae TaxID=2983764 RepID=A0ABT3YL30_9HYPH|nr:phage baseplate assembly protein V [Hoeflea ulvae]MCY0096586.1 phage baseplate assembly protein V [Hoeflea ulvae]